MEANIANHGERDNAATGQVRNDLCIVIGPHRLRNTNWEEAAAIATNGSGWFRNGNVLTLISSEAYEQLRMS